MVEFKGAIFDLDGVIESTVQAHMGSWKEMFDSFLQEYSKKNNKKYIPFDSDFDYREFVDGRPRYEGVRNFLQSRNIILPYGDVNDSPEKETVTGLGNRKNVLYKKHIQEHKPQVYREAVAFVKKLKKGGVRVALVSSSKNTKLILNKTGLSHLFKVIVDGNTLEKEKLQGKPHPDAFIFAAQKLKVDESECVVFEDAISGVEAGRRGNFGMVVGVKRDSASLPNSDKVITNFRQISVRDIKQWFRNGISEHNWNVSYRKLRLENELKRETLCSIGNGYLGVRGCFETQKASQFHYPGFYIAGIYNELTTDIKGKKARNNDLVNCPNWLAVEITIGKDVIDPFACDVVSYEKNLDIHSAVLKHKLIFIDRKGRKTKVESRRFASMDNPHVLCLKFSITPLNYSEAIRLTSCIDGSVENKNVERYKTLRSKHLRIVKKEKVGNCFLLHARTNSSEYDIMMVGKHVTKLKKKYVHGKKTVGEALYVPGKKMKTYSFEKLVSVYTSLDGTEYAEKALQTLNTLARFETLQTAHEKCWKNLWKDAGILIDGDRNAQRILLLHAYHLNSSYSPHVSQWDVGVLARGLTGEAYHGHIFWDEIYTYPYYLHRFPAVARACLLYRCRRLEAAVDYARENGYSGAMFPWQSADSGKEETQMLHYNPKSGKWGPDFSRNQRHVSLAIFYNFYKYINHSDDSNFLYKDGIWTMVEIARFWGSIAKPSKRDSKYHINHVMGPDEFHENYPRGKKALNDNAYTNIMVSWLFDTMLSVMKTVPNHLKKRLDITEEEIKRWEDISKNMYVPVKNGIIMQHEGFDTLEHVDFEKYVKKYGDISRMDRILKSEGKSPDYYKVLKQADMLMIFYLLPLDEVVRVLKRLGVRVRSRRAFLKKHYEYYSRITTHGSSLSRFVHDAISLSITKDPCIWNFFIRAMQIDIEDSQGGSTREGVHMGMMAGTFNFVRKYLCGIKTHEGGISLEPYYPKHWKRFETRLHHQGRRLYFIFTPQTIEVTLEKGGAFYVHYKGKKYSMKKGETITLRGVRTFDKDLLKKC